MQAHTIYNQTIAIYLDVARTAMQHDSSLASKMLTAAFIEVRETRHSNDLGIVVGLGELLVISDMLDQAEAIFNIALKISNSSIGGKDWLRARIYDGLAEVYVSQGKFEKAKRKCEQALKVISEIANVDRSIVASRIRRLALLNFKSGDNEKAAALLQDAAFLNQSIGY